MQITELTLRSYRSYDTLHLAFDPGVQIFLGANAQGKTNIIEALYYGAPVLTTPIGAEGIPDAASVMEIREDAADFAAATLQLYRDRDALTAMAERAARYIRAHNSMDAVWAELKDDFA